MEKVKKREEKNKVNQYLIPQWVTKVISDYLCRHSIWSGIMGNQHHATAAYKKKEEIQKDIATEYPGKGKKGKNSLSHLCCSVFPFFFLFHYYCSVRDVGVARASKAAVVLGFLILGTKK
ncbi:hypothetical protein CEXT_517421 [Caerostris extrusa]|uniref:Uncharacterized protein n=1 Tax=Caerostris extrusa TaxID=172846 RepID=A0AAV4W6T7_CAEEX|nr:hypothetical protein CEXT_517421 [Caerostris extrusa]